MEIKNVTFSYDNVTDRLKSVSSEIEIGKSYNNYWSKWLREIDITWRDVKKS